MLTFVLPLSEIISDFHDKLKSLSSGYASFDYEPQGYQSTSMVKLETLLNGQPVDELARIVHPSKATSCARDLVYQLREKIPRQMIQIAIQVCANGKVLARETLKAYRKDVTAKLVTLSISFYHLHLKRFSSPFDYSMAVILPDERNYLNSKARVKNACDLLLV